MPWARASSLERHMACPAASHYPQANNGTWGPGFLHVGEFTPPAVELEDRDTSAARWGTAMHAAKANAADAYDPFLSMMDPYRDELWPTALGKHELSVSYDCDTGVVSLFEDTSEDARSAWKMQQAASCVVGTCDWWGEMPTGEPWVDDLKTGWRRPDVATPQLLFYLMCRMQGGDWTTGRLSVTWWPRKKGNSEPTREGLWKHVSRQEVDQFERDLQAAWIRAQQPQSYPKPGGHCLYCPSSLVCPVVNR